MNARSAAFVVGLMAGFVVVGALAVGQVQGLLDDLVGDAFDGPRSATRNGERPAPVRAGRG